MASTEYMNRQTKVIIFIIAGFMVLAGIIIIISVLFSTNTSEPVATPQPTVQPTDNKPSLTDADNDYSNDEGYVSLPEDFDPTVNDTTNTVYNDEYAYFTVNRVMCELSNKKVITEESLKPLSLLIKDFAVNSSPYAVNSKTQLNKELEWFTQRLGEEMPESKRSDLQLLYCEVQSTDTHDTEWDRN